MIPLIEVTISFGGVKGSVLATILPALVAAFVSAIGIFFAYRAALNTVKSNERIKAADHSNSSQRERIIQISTILALLRKPNCTAGNSDIPNQIELFRFSSIGDGHQRDNLISILGRFYLGESSAEWIERVSAASEQYITSMSTRTP